MCRFWSLDLSWGPGVGETSRVVDPVLEVASRSRCLLSSLHDLPSLDSPFIISVCWGGWVSFWPLP